MNGAETLAMYFNQVNEFGKHASLEECIDEAINLAIQNERKKHTDFREKVLAHRNDFIDRNFQKQECVEDVNYTEGIYYN